MLKLYLSFAVLIVLSLGVFVWLEKNSDTLAFVLNPDSQLGKQSLQVLNQIGVQNSVLFEVYSHPQSLLAKKIHQFFAPYLRANKHMDLVFIDPTSHPSEVAVNAVSLQGEIVLKFQAQDATKKIHITQLSEEEIINAILKLFNQNDEWLVLAQGYGMADIADESDIGLSKFFIHLKKLGFRVARMPLNTANVLPDNVKVIILPAPTKPLDSEMVQWLQQQILQGISLWWLTDVEVATQPQLELAMDVISGHKISLKDQQDSAYLSDFPTHAITQNFNQPIYIAQAKEIIAEAYVPLLHNAQQQVFAASKETANSRVLITGDADFIRNQYIDAGANKSLMVRMVDWLLWNQHRLNIPVTINENTQMTLTQGQLVWLSVIFLLLVPIIFILIALYQWRKSHAQ